MATTYEAGLQKFLAEATAAYQRMFESEEQAGLRTFSQREVRVYDEGRRLARWLLEEHLERDQNSQPEADTLPCPDCKRPSARVGDDCETRPLTTRVGDITFPRAKFRCKHCRKSFFPSGLHVGTAQQSPEPRSAQARR